MTNWHAINIATVLEEFVRYRPRITTRAAQRHWNMSERMQEAERLTGQKFKPRDYLGAAIALRALNQPTNQPTGALQ